MKVTIIIPFYNEEKRIVLESFHQIFKNSSQYDFILVDDGSSDNTLEVLNQFKEKPDEVVDQVEEIKPQVEVQKKNQESEPISEDYKVLNYTNRNGEH